MASADSPTSLKAGASPGKVHELSTRAARLYRMCLSVTFGFRASSRTHRPHPASTCSYSCGRIFATDFFQLRSLRFRPCPSLRLLSLLHDHFLSNDKFMPMLGTLVVAAGSEISEPAFLIGNDAESNESMRETDRRDGYFDMLGGTITVRIVVQRQEQIPRLVEIDRRPVRQIR